MKTYQVPVYFTINAETSQEAVYRMLNELGNWERLDQIPEYRMGIPWADKMPLDNSATTK